MSAGAERSSVLLEFLKHLGIDVPPEHHDIIARYSTNRELALEELPRHLTWQRTLVAGRLLNAAAKWAAIRAAGAPLPPPISSPEEELHAISKILDPATPLADKIALTTGAWTPSAQVLDVVLQRQATSQWEDERDRLLQQTSQLRMQLAVAQRELKERRTALRILIPLGCFGGGYLLSWCVHTVLGGP